MQMASNLTFLIESGKQLGLPGLLNLEKSRWANTLRDRRPDAATNAHIWSNTKPLVLSTQWEAAVDDFVQTLRPLAPAHANRISGVPHDWGRARLRSLSALSWPASCTTRSQAQASLSSRTSVSAWVSPARRTQTAPRKALVLGRRAAVTGSVTQRSGQRFQPDWITSAAMSTATALRRQFWHNITLKSSSFRY